MFREQLDKFNKTGLSVWRVMVAAEVDSHGEIQLSEDEFEIVCDFVYEWVMTTEASAQEVTDRVVAALLDGVFTVKDMETDFERVEQIINSTF